MQPFYVYMLRCADDSYYIGQTDSIETRLAQHQAGTVRGYTHTAGDPWCLFGLVSSRVAPTRLSASVSSRAWSRAKKEALTRADWAEIHELAKRRGPSTAGPQSRALRSG